MSGSTLYDDDILLWSEQQAAAIRALARSPGTVPNDLDIENVAEEIESVGRSELAAVRSLIRLILIHVMKLAAEPDASSAPHWRAEIIAFHADFLGRYVPSMRQRIDLNHIWASAREQLMASYGDDGCRRIEEAPSSSAVGWDELLAKRFDSAAAVARLAAPPAAR